MTTMTEGSTEQRDADSAPDPAPGEEGDSPSDEPGPASPEPAPAGAIEFSTAPAVAPHVQNDIPWLTDKLAHAVALLDRPAARIAVRLVDDAEMTALHRRHMDDPTTTDVLTFPAGEQHNQPEIDVDIAVCVDEARRQAADRTHDLKLEILLYALHGVLHCAGYDDHDQHDWRTMHQREDELLRAVGVGGAFADDQEGADL